jgi:endonuclease I
MNHQSSAIITPYRGRNKMTIAFFFSFLILLADSTADYYESIDPDAGDLKQQLHDLINDHTVYSYDDIWNVFPSVDIYLSTYPCDINASHIPDIYSSYCWTTDKVVPGGECGNYKLEGDCFNREHLWPKSWFGGFDAGANAQTDLFELWPSDGYVNGLRGDLPFGVVDKNNVSYKSTNGCLIGGCAGNVSDYSGKCFEPADILKGDFARSYFYLSTAYLDKWSCCDTAGTYKSSIKPWMESILRTWHSADFVDDQERERNEVIYSEWQHNRNPFIDYPDWVDKISDF